jgi:hypothetical protein
LMNPIKLRFARVEEATTITGFPEEPRMERVVLLTTNIEESREKVESGSVEL